MPLEYLKNLLKDCSVEEHADYFLFTRTDEASVCLLKGRPKKLPKLSPCPIFIVEDENTFLPAYILLKKADFALYDRRKIRRGLRISPLPLLKVSLPILIKSPLLQGEEKRVLCPLHPSSFHFSGDAVDLLQKNAYCRKPAISALKAFYERLQKKLDRSPSNPFF